VAVIQYEVSIDVH